MKQILDQLLEGFFAGITFSYPNEDVMKENLKQLETNIQFSPMFVSYCKELMNVFISNLCVQQNNLIFNLVFDNIWTDIHL